VIKFIIANIHGCKTQVDQEVENKF